MSTTNLVLREAAAVPPVAQVEVVLSTHAVGGLTMPDLVLAAKLDTIEVEYSPKWVKQQLEKQQQQQ